MKMNNYLETYEIKDIKSYCQNRCIKIVNEKLNQKEQLQYHRGNYKGYLYGIKVCNNLLNQNIKLKKYELYHLKEQKRRSLYNCNITGGFSSGLKDSFYDLLNYISIKEIKLY